MTENAIYVDVAIIGAGTAGASALKQVKRAGKTFVVIDPGPLGTTCARTGCMPSKAVLHAATLWQGMQSSAGVHSVATEAINPDALWRASRRVRDALAAGAAEKIVSAAGGHLLMGHARFVDHNVVEVGRRRIQAKAFVVATGSMPVVPAFLEGVKDHVLTTDSLFERETLPRSIGILGMGAIGLEIGLALSRLGVQVVAADQKSLPGGITDPEIGFQAIQYLSSRNGLAIWLGSPVHVTQSADHIAMISCNAKREVEWVLAALGRKPALDGLQLEAAGVILDNRGYPAVDLGTMRSGETALYIAGDANPDRPLQHEAADEGAIAGWNAAHHGASRRFRRRVPLSIIFSDPDIALVGMTLDQLDEEQVVIGTSSGRANGRSRVLGAEDNLVRIYAERSTGILLGAAIFAIRGEHIAHLLAWAIQRRETAETLLQMPFYHPTIEEMVQSALAEIVEEISGVRPSPAGLREDA